MIYISTDFLVFLLILFATFIVCLKPLSSFMKERISSTIASASIALMVSYFMTYSKVEIIKEIYSTGFIITALAIPTIMIFFFIYSSSIASTFRKAFWIIYGVMSVYLLSKANNPKTIIITITIILISAIILLDNKIKHLFSIKKNLKFHNNKS